MSRDGSKGRFYYLGIQNSINLTFYGKMTAAAPSVDCGGQRHSVGLTFTVPNISLALIDAILCRSTEPDRSYYFSSGLLWCSSVTGSFLNSRLTVKGRSCRLS